MASLSLNAKSWNRADGETTYLISTSPELLDHDFINRAFGTEEMFWATPLEPDLLALMLSQSVTLGVYLKTTPTSTEESSPLHTTRPAISDVEAEKSLKQVGMARFVTDHVSTAYLTDVYISPEHRQGGLGKWLVACCKEVLDEHPALRRAFLVASAVVGKAFYARELGFWDVREESDRLVCMTRKTFA